MFALNMYSVQYTADSKKVADISPVFNTLTQ